MDDGIRSRRSSFRIVPLAGEFAVQKRTLGIWFYHRVLDPNAPIEAPAPLSLIKRFATKADAELFIHQNLC